MRHNAERASEIKVAPGGGFRSDINALRAIAATVVVLFHFGIAPFGGGFIGVDVFFVISGLLMTQIIESGIEQGGFSILGFYAARARRIVPAITVCCLIVILLGTVFLDPLILDETASNALSTMLFYSNMRYVLQGGYFSDAAEANWFLHSWTLSVEWQFYLIYPVLLVIASKWHWLWARRAPVALGCCVLLFLITMGIADQSTRIREWAFYLLPTRAWEMLAGGCLAFYRPVIGPAVSRVLALGGLAVILLSVVLIGPAIPWPSSWLLFPVLGTVAILAARRQDLVWSDLPGMKTTGLWSYSLYLWHWPVIAAIRYYDLPQDMLVMGGGVILCFALAGLSYSLVETRLRDLVFGPGKTTSRRRWLLILCVWLVALGVVGAAKVTHGFVDQRAAALPASARAVLADYRAAIDDWPPSLPCPLTFSGAKDCRFGKEGVGEKILIIGDSHAEQMIPRLQALATSRSLDIELLRLQGCAPVLGTRWTGANSPCGDFGGKALDYARAHHFKRVVIFAAWAAYFSNPSGRRFKPDLWCEPGIVYCSPLSDDARAWTMIDHGFGEMAEKLRAVRASGADTVLVLPQPSPPRGSPRDFYRQTFLSGHAVVPPPIAASEFRARTSRLRALMQRTAQASGSRLVDPLDVQCPGGVCPVRHNGHYLYKDTHHVRWSVVGTPQLHWFDDAVTGAAK